MIRVSLAEPGGGAAGGERVRAQLLEGRVVLGSGVGAGQEVAAGGVGQVHHGDARCGADAQDVHGAKARCRAAQRPERQHVDQHPALVGQAGEAGELVAHHRPPADHLQQRGLGNDHGEDLRAVPECALPGQQRLDRAGAVAVLRSA
jgi:hypothetical protein